ncbi:hypothetical protein ACQPYK_40785 [Streptosporangium sp. CA-135522]|uniref:hypothetical protein n=1 Tax=Streptosporangium sp. CA-135522 TaxID=3240072 RepID=UPI003D9437F8
MGRHGGHGEDAPRNRGKREPAPAPEPDYLDEPIGRRLRPEESAVTEPRTGFLGSGWSNTTELSDPVWPEEKRRSGGRVKTVVLAIAAVAVVLGGTVAGVQLLSSPAGSTADCPVGGCLAETPGRPNPYPTDQPDPAEQSEEPAPSEEPDKAGKKTATPVPTPTITRRRTGRTFTARPTPTPERTRAPRRTQPPRPTEEPEPQPDPTDQSAVTDTRTQDPAHTPTATEPPSQPSPTAPETPAAGGAPVTVGYDLVKERQEVYTAKLVVTTGDRITGLTLSLPVGGEVTSLTGAEWKQDGDTLILEPSGGLEAGEDLVLTFTAYGRAQAPQTCRSTRGECTVL